jgi:hypothetical protein
MSIRYLPALKDKEGNRLVGIMGNFATPREAYEHLLADGLYFAVGGAIPDGVVEYDPDVGLENVEVSGSFGMFPFKASCIAGPAFEEAIAKRAPDVGKREVTE